ncbi:hypothetical protein HMPREF9952_2131 [Haemophilus pittmaniae HK 85]|mgnify:CR=1 FL=1|uniref:Uncharacterized protein n=1 Tax=Haemophilus pittmaniae HK 85 TaxID=1035188 RepID=F9Q672_9PAST|nr:hypothetical protein [Haemophilus pittmaniae]EGV07452.1 hypothetical protein HMPREF9952_2131 [Haemophilus pittmaniae HK 85]SNV62917.1 Uncharacterised protein [Haemophilus pittmaniae]
MECGQGLRIIQKNFDCARNKQAMKEYFHGRTNIRSKEKADKNRLLQEMMD